MTVPFPRLLCVEKSLDILTSSPGWIIISALFSCYTTTYIWYFIYSVIHTAIKWSSVILTSRINVSFNNKVSTGNLKFGCRPKDIFCISVFQNNVYFLKKILPCSAKCIFILFCSSEVVCQSLAFVELCCF